MKSIIKQVIFVFITLILLISSVSITAFNNSRYLVSEIEKTEYDTVTPLRYFSNLSTHIFDSTNLALMYSPNTSLRNTTAAPNTNLLISASDINNSIDSLQQMLNQQELSYLMSLLNEEQIGTFNEVLNSFALPWCYHRLTLKIVVQPPR